MGSFIPPSVDHPATSRLADARIPWRNISADHLLFTSRTLRALASLGGRVRSSGRGTMSLRTYFLRRAVLLGSLTLLLFAPGSVPASAETQPPSPPQAPTSGDDKGFFIRSDNYEIHIG